VRSAMTLFLLLLASAVSADTLRDPMRPYRAPVKRVAETPDFDVQAVFVSSRRKLAIINGARVRVGDRIAGASVIDIERGLVTLELNGRRIEVSSRRGER